MVIRTGGSLTQEFAHNFDISLAYPDVKCYNKI